MNYKITLAYDGTKYSGWQRNKNAEDTIQHKLDVAFSKYFGETVQVIGAGRTDKGVHAKAMVANFHLKQVIDVNRSRMEMNHYLPEDIGIVNIEEVDERFHSRYAAVSKTYAYTFIKAYEGIKPIFNRHYAVKLEKKPNIDAMKYAAGQLIGSHDFKGYSPDKTKKSTVREITAISFDESDERTDISFKRNGCLYHLVTILAGTLLEIGYGERKVNSIEKVFESGIRSEAGYLAQAKGLALEAVRYEEV